MKIMSKSIIIDQSLEININREREILSKLSKINNKFITNIFCSFQDFSNLYLVLQLITGGDLRYHLYNYNKQYTEEMIKFIIMNILLCLQCIHEKGIIHRDIKPENFLFDEDGYLHLTDFGLAVYKNENNNINYIDNDKENYIGNEIVGTLGYMAPEMILGMIDKESFPIDYYSFGIICYEIIFRKRPYKGKTRYQIGKEMLNEEINYDINLKYSDKLINFIKKLLIINPEERLGSVSGINEIKNNQYLKHLNFNQIQNKNFKSPFVEIIQYLRELNIKNNNKYELFDIINCNKSFEFDEETNLRLSKIEANQNYVFYFREYSYINFNNDDIKYIQENKDISHFKNTYSDKKIIKIKERKLSRSNSDIYSYRSRNNSKEVELILPEIHPKLLRNIYKYKIVKYKGLINKINKKNNYINNEEDKKNKEKEKDKDKTKSKDKKDKKDNNKDNNEDNSENSERKKLIINNFYSPDGNSIFNPYYQTPFTSVQNNFILPQINPFLKGFNAYYNLNKNIKRENDRYSRCSSSETYEKRNKKIKLKLKEKNLDKIKNEEKNVIDDDENNKSNSKNEKMNDKNQIDKKSKKIKKLKLKESNKEKEKNNDKSNSKTNIKKVQNEKIEGDDSSAKKKIQKNKISENKNVKIKKSEDKNNKVKNKKKKKSNSSKEESKSNEEEESEELSIIPEKSESEEISSTQVNQDEEENEQEDNEQNEKNESNEEENNSEEDD